MVATSVETALEQVNDGLAAAVQRQRRDRDPAHEDFYGWGWALSDLTMRMQDAGQVLARQVAAYGDQRLLRDDAGGDPRARLIEAKRSLDEMSAALAVANEAARRFHSAIGHIAVEVDPDAAP